MRNFDFYILKIFAFLFSLFAPILPFFKQFLNQPLGAARVEAATMFGKHNYHGYKEYIISYLKPNVCLIP